MSPNLLLVEHESLRGVERVFGGLGKRQEGALSSFRINMVLRKGWQSSEWYSEEEEEVSLLPTPTVLCLIVNLFI